MRGLTAFIQHKFPLISSLKRFFIAYLGTLLPCKDTYSQSGEDKIVLEILKEYDISKYVYIDAGANQPTQISNTFLFYRLGYYGVNIEPNPELIGLFHLFRPRDKNFCVGLGSSPCIKEFHHSFASVLSSFSKENVIKGGVIVKHEYLPILPLDLIVQELSLSGVFMLSIDCEGCDFDVLKGALNTLAITLVVIVESGDSHQTENVTSLLYNSSFELVAKTIHNLIFLNQVMSKKLECK